jgi:hypothetical protein
MILAEAAGFGKRSVLASAIRISLMAGIGQYFQNSAPGRKIVDADKQHEAWHQWKISSLEDCR